MPIRGPVPMPIDTHSCIDGSVGAVFSVPGTHRTPSELPIAIGMDKTGIAHTKQSL
jgi:hypothetical protein